MTLPKKLIVPITTFSGGLFVVILWTIIYKINLGVIGFNGPAGLGLLLAIFSGILVFGILSTRYVIRRKYLRPSVAVTSFVITGILTTIILGYAMSSLALRFFPDRYEESDPCYVTTEFLDETVICPAAD